MNSRVNKYQNNERLMSRVDKNRNIYARLNNQDLNNLEIKSNATVIGNQKDEIDVEQIKKILDTKYNKVPQRRSIKLDTYDEPEEKKLEEHTKEYDLHLVLEKAKDDVDESYEEVRNKKLRDTQFDILSNLNIDELKEEKETTENSDAELMDLINTISINEDKVKEHSINKNDKDDNDLLSLLYDDNTDKYDIYTGIKDEIEKIENTSKVFNDKTDENKKLDQSFFTTQDVFKDEDFDEDDFVEDTKMSFGLKLLITILIVAFVIGLYIFITSYFK